MSGRFLAVGLAIAASAAWAQPNYVIQSSSAAYAPLSGGTSQLAAFGSNTADDRAIVVPIGFSFPYYGTNYTQLIIDTNGFVSFTTSLCLTSGCNNGVAMPSFTRTPHNVIAPWWDDHQFNQGGNMTTDVHTRSLPGQFDVEWRNVNAYSSSGFVYQVTFKLTLFSSGSFQIHYGPKTGSGGTAVAGFEDATGMMGASLPMPPTNMPCSTGASNCTLINFPTDTLYIIGQPLQPDLVVTTVSLANLVAGGTGNLTFDVTATFQNFGQMAATGPFAWKAYLSTDRLLSPATDMLVYTSAATLSLTGAGTPGATVMATGSAGTVSPPVPGQYYVLVEADTTGVVTEAIETNNVGSTSNYFTNGLDLVATAISGPPMSGPGTAMMLNLKWFNQGSSAAGMVSYRVLLSTDALLSANDFVLTNGVRSVSGGQTIDENINLTVPMNVPGGDFYFLFQIDPNNTINEASETNNVVASVAQVTITLADLVNNATDFLQPSTMMPTQVGDFGQPALVSLSFANPGGAVANNFQVSVVLSADANLSLLSDTIVYQQNVAQTLPGGMAALNLAFTLPLNNAAMVPFQSGNYYVFTIVDSGDAVNESNEFNNIRMVTGSVFLRAPGFDGGSGTGGGAGGGGGSGGGTAGGAAGGTAGGAAGGSAGGTAGGSAGGAAGGSAGGAAGGSAGGAAGGSAGGEAGGSAGGSAGGEAGGSAGGSAGGTGGGSAGGSAGGAAGGLATGGGTGGGEEMPKGCGCSSSSELPALFGLALLASLRRRRRLPLPN